MSFIKKDEDVCGLKTVYTPCGLQGPEGPPGESPILYNYYDKEVIDFTWQASELVITGMTHTFTGDSGDVSVRVDLRNSYRDQSSGSIKLYVNAIEVIMWGPQQQGLLNGANDFIQISDSFTWRGAVNQGDVIEVKATSTTVGKIATFQYTLLISS
tara:strand:- start:2516 stop:2983 length:468 start_codon:yes stop_codon:yes gene_type:complete